MTEIWKCVRAERLLDEFQGEDISQFELCGINVRESDDPYIPIAEEALDGLAEAGVIGAFAVDMFPILKYVPGWFPGAGFQKKAARWKEANIIMAEKPFRYVEEQLVEDHFFASS